MDAKQNVKNVKRSSGLFQEDRFHLFIFVLHRQIQEPGKQDEQGGTEEDTAENVREPMYAGKQSAEYRRKDQDAGYCLKETA